MSMRLLSKVAANAGGVGTASAPLPEARRKGSKDANANIESGPPCGNNSHRGSRQGSSGHSGAAAAGAAASPAAGSAILPDGLSVDHLKSFYELAEEMTNEYDRVRGQLSEMCAENARLRFHLEERAKLGDLAPPFSPSPRRHRHRTGEGPAAGSNGKTAAALASEKTAAAPSSESPACGEMVFSGSDRERLSLRLKAPAKNSFPAQESILVPEPEKPESPRPPPGDPDTLSQDSGQMILPESENGGCLSATSIGSQGHKVGVRFSGVVDEEEFEGVQAEHQQSDGDGMDRVSFLSVNSAMSAKSITDQLMIVDRANLMTSQDGGEFDLLPVWTNKVHKKGRRMSGFGGGLQIAAAHYCSRREKAEPCCIFRLMAPFTTRPSSRIAVCWDTLTIIVLMWDLVVIPLSAYELPQHSIWGIMEIVATVTWTFDLIFSFFRGYEVSGDIEMKPRSIMKHYLRTWFTFDISIVGVDWFLFFVESGDLVDWLRFSRFRRALRLLRLARLVKHGQRFLAIIQHVQSEEWLVIIRIVWLLMVLIVVNHFISCAWYAVGTMDVFEETWVGKAFEEQDHTKALGYRYLTSFHWSVTQFTPASMEVTPRNTIERCFNICMIFLGLLMFSSFVSNMTNGMTYLTKRNYEKRQERDALMSYLNAKTISLALRHDISMFHSARGNARSRRILAEGDITSLRTLPEVLVERLRIEVHTPVLKQHSLFSHIHSEERNLLYRICHQAMRDRTLKMQEELFRFGVRCTRMYFMINGSGKYIVGYGDDETPPVEVLPRHWISEGCLWFQWEHRGRLQAKEACEMSELNSLEFQSLVSRSGLLVEIQRYAKLYAHHAERENGGADFVTDLWGQRLRVMDLVQKSFRPEEADAENPASKVMSLWAGAEITQEICFTEWKLLFTREKSLRQPGLRNKVRRIFRKAPSFIPGQVWTALSPAGSNERSSSKASNGSLVGSGRPHAVWMERRPSVSSSQASDDVL